jgi:hypothetical protein
MRFILVETCYSQVKDPDAEGKTVYDTWSSMNGGINVRIWVFFKKKSSCIWYCGDLDLLVPKWLKVKREFHSIAM